MNGSAAKIYYPQDGSLSYAEIQTTQEDQTTSLVLQDGRSFVETLVKLYETREVPKGLLKLIKKLTHKEPSKRLMPKDLLKDKWIRSVSTKKTKDKKDKKEKKAKEEKNDKDEKKDKKEKKKKGEKQNNEEKKDNNAEN